MTLKRYFETFIWFMIWLAVEIKKESSIMDVRCKLKGWQIWTNLSSTLQMLKNKRFIDVVGQ